MAAAANSAIITAASHNINMQQSECSVPRLFFFVKRIIQ